MTEGEEFVLALPLKRAFYDRHEERGYRRATEVAKYIVDDAQAIEKANVFLRTHMQDDPHQRDAFLMWQSLLEQPRREIARALLEDSDRGAQLRGTAPVFVVVNYDRKHGQWRLAR